jgi:AcrR family transcriptional regulator
MSPRPDVSDERKNQILTAAEKVFTEKGFDQARMEDIAEQTGLSKGSLYRYFKSKDDLIIAILDRLFQLEFRQMEKLVISEQSARQCVDEFTDLATRNISAMLRLMPIAYEFLALAFRNKYVQHALKQYLNRYLDILIPIIQRGIDSGEFRAVDAREVALAAGAIFEGTILLWVYDKTAVDPIYHIHSSIRLLMEGVTAP